MLRIFKVFNLCAVTNLCILANLQWLQNVANPDQNYSFLYQFYYFFLTAFVFNPLIQRDALLYYSLMLSIK